MAFFLLPLIAAGMGLAGKGVMDYMELGADAEAAEGFLGALKKARRDVPGSEIGPTGPMMPETEIDYMALGEAMLEGGDPAGMNILLSADKSRREAEAAASSSALEHQRRMELEAYKQNAQNQRQQRDLAAKQQADQLALSQGFMPTYHAPGSEGHFKLLDEGTSLQYATSILRDFQDSLSAFGTESWGERSGALASKRQQLMLFLKEGEKTGAIDAGTVELFEQMLPDPTALTGDLVNTEAGKLAALIDLFNSKYIPSYNARAMYSTQLPEIGAIPNEEIIPPGLEPVDEAYMQREREMMDALAEEQRINRGARITYGGQAEMERGLDRLTGAAQSGDLIAR